MPSKKGSIKMRVSKETFVPLSSGISSDEGDDVTDDEMVEIGKEKEESEEEMEGMDHISEDKVPKSVKLSNAITKILSAGQTPRQEEDLLLKKKKPRLESQPILALNNSLAKSLDSQKLESRARRLLTLEKKKLAEIGRLVPTVATDVDKEKALRKTATRGVVQLFNAIKAAQKTLERVQADGIQKHIEEAPKLAKASFLEKMLETSGGLGSTMRQSGETHESEASMITTSKAIESTSTDKKGQAATAVIKSGGKSVVASETTMSSQPAWLKGNFLTDSKGVSGWDQIEEEAEDEIL